MKRPASLYLPGALTCVVLAGALIYGLWPDADAERPSAEFHQIAAQIIPVLILAVAVERRRGDSPWRHPVLAALFVGQITAMLAVAFGTKESGTYLIWSPGWTDVLSALSVAALCLGFSGVVLMAIGRY